MGLFGGISKKEARNQVFNILLNSDLMQSILKDITRLIDEDDNFWLYSTRSYYDDRKRTVVVHEDGISFYNCPASKIRDIEDVLKTARISRKFMWLSSSAYDNGAMQDERRWKAIESIDNIKSVHLFYTWYGYTPVTAYADVDGYQVLDKMQVLGVMASAFKKHLEECMSKSKYSEIMDINLDVMKGYEFSYQVPELEWQKWF